uniref:DUF4939 domain-containing protein n=1 Tax=Sinocyclocheilus anshuiensis TaxID=1608454 RepID=A0A671RMN4_9TELE
VLIVNYQPQKLNRLQHGLMDSRSTSSPEPLPIRTVTASPPACPMARPASFSGEAAFCSGFLLQCSLYLEMQPHLFVTERAKVSFIISLLSGRALQWAEALWNSQSPWIHSLDGFVKHFREVFGQSTTEVTVGEYYPDHS